MEAEPRRQRRRRFRRRVRERSRVAHRIAGRRLARRPNRGAREPADRAALAGLLAGAAFLVVLLAIASSLDLTGEDAPSARAPEGPPPSVRAIDRDASVVFRRTGRSLTIKLGREAPRRVLGVRGRTVRLVCGHLRPLGSGLYQRRLAWPERSRFNTLNLPPEVAATVQFCALRRDGRTLARGRFGG